MMFCAKCGASNPSESVFCGGCGSSLTPMQDARPASSEQVPATASTPMLASDEAPTLLTPLERPLVQPQATPAANEILNVELPAQGVPAPTPGSFSDAFQEQAPTAFASPSGANYPPQGAAMPNYLSGANYPPQDAAMPIYASGANYPPQGAAMPMYASGANYPPQGATIPNYPSGANYPPATPMPGAYASQPSWGGYPGMMPQPPAAPPSKLIQPLPLWMTIVNSIIVASVLAALMFFTGSDWAAGAQTAGIAALILGLLMLIAFGVRAVLGMLASTNTHRLSQVVSAVVLTVLLFGYGAFGMTGQSTIHALQAHALESQQQWQNAISEYQASGQAQPTSVDIARTYNEWGNALKSQQQYASALTKFSTVMTSYGQATDQVTQAQSNAIATYQAWGSQATQQKHYGDATQHYDELLSQLYCSAPCQSSTKALDATAYFNLAEQQLTAGNFADAVAAFTKLTTDANLKSSPEAAKVHGDYAKALLGDGKQALTTTCSSALPLYQQLSTDFSDTPEGQEAKQALSAPVQVKGHFTTSVPASSTTPFVLLSANQITNSTTLAQFQAIFSGSPHSTINSDGTFTLANVKPGSYQFSWGTLTNSDQIIRIISRVNNSTIGQLCTFDFGDISDPIPPNNA